MSEIETPVPLRFVTAASLFDGHDAAINIMRRVMLSEGAEVIHLGHDRGVVEIVDAAIEEDADGIAISSYQGGHVEYFTWMVELLEERGRGDIPVFGGGGGTITDREIETLHARGVARIYSVEDGRELGLVGMIRDMLERARANTKRRQWLADDGIAADDAVALGRAATLLEVGSDRAREPLRAVVGASSTSCTVLGITGTGGAGKSSLTDELLRRFLQTWPERRFAVLSVDPSRRRTGGALLGDRIRMNAASNPRAFMRSIATRGAHLAVSTSVEDTLEMLKAAGFDLVILETAGIGQSGTQVVDLSDLSIYVMTPEFGAPTQLEKIDMLDFADMIVINKSDKRGADDALGYVRKQVRRNTQRFDAALEDMPVFPCVASRYGDVGVDRMFHALAQTLDNKDAADWSSEAPPERDAQMHIVVPANRSRYLSEVSDTIRRYHANTGRQAAAAASADGIIRALRALGAAVPETALPDPSEPAFDEVDALGEAYKKAYASIDPDGVTALREVDRLRERYTADVNEYEVRGRTIRAENFRETLSHLRVPRVALPSTRDWGELLRWRRSENVPGEFPFTAGVFPYKRDGEDPTRMFAGEGMAERTNRRFHYVSRGQPAHRLSTAFDSVTLYGRDPAARPDVLGKIGNSGVSVATLDDARRLYSGFDLCAPTTSVSMTINGPAPMILAMFLNTAIDQAVEARLRESGRWEAAIAKASAGRSLPVYRSGELPEGHNGGGLGLLGLSGDLVVDADEYAEIRSAVLSQVRGTVQADIFKEDQAQNTCIFSTEFALRMMGDIQEYFVENNVRNFYSVSISGYHIAEAGANPISQLAFTLANGLTIVEYYRARGMDVDRFARNLSFFFSNGIDPEYAVIGRVARRIWAIAMRDVYGASERSQKLKYHIQTSGRSLHAQEIQFNDIRTTLQALYALADNCNSLHTNAYDEAITTPTEESVRRALAIQLILNHEFGLFRNENPLQGAYIVEALTDMVEAAVLEEFDRINDRGGVLGAMETMYQRSKIQEESHEYETKKHSGEIPIMGVNTFIAPDAGDGVVEVEMMRSTDDEKRQQIEGVAAFREMHADRSAAALERLQQVAIRGGNTFAELMETVKTCSLGQITDALFAVGGQYRRSM